MSGNTRSNGRVTMALLGQKLDTLISQQAELSRDFKDHLTQAARRDERISLLEQSNQDHDGDIKRIDDKFDGIKKISYIGDAITAGLAAGMAILAGWFGHK